VERVNQTACDLQDLSTRPGVPPDLRQEAGTAAAAVEEAVQRFHQGIGASDDGQGIRTARFAFEQDVMSIVARHQSIHLALAALAETVEPPPAPAARVARTKKALPTAPPRRT
jgi:hypothetical protein